MLYGQAVFLFSVNRRVSRIVLRFQFRVRPLLSLVISILIFIQRTVRIFVK